MVNLVDSLVNLCTVFISTNIDKEIKSRSTIGDLTEDLQLKIFHLASRGKSLDASQLKGFLNANRFALNLNGYSWIPSSLFYSLPESCPNLVQLSLSDCKVSDSEVARIARCSNLTSLNLEGCKDITDIAIGYLIANGCTNLENLNLSRIPNITHATLARLFHFQKLNMLEISGCVKLDNSHELSILNLNDGAPQSLTKLSLKNWYHLTDDSLHLLLTGRQWSYLDLSYCSQLSNDAFNGSFLSNELSNLNILRLTDCCKITDNVMINLYENCRESLRLIDIEGCKLVTNKGVEALLQIPNLVEIDLADVARVTDAAFKKIHSKNLMSITLLGQQITDEALVSIGSSCPRLHTLSISNCKVSDQGLIAIANGCNELKTIELTLAPRITDNSIQAIILNNKKLKKITINYITSITENSFKNIKQCKSIKYINISGCRQIDLPFVEYLKDCYSLEKLSILECKNFNGNAVTSLLENHPLLETIYVDGNYISNDLIRSLSVKFPKVNIFDLS